MGAVERVTRNCWIEFVAASEDAETRKLWTGRESDAQTRTNFNIQRLQMALHDFHSVGIALNSRGAHSHNEKEADRGSTRNEADQE
jgi:hypothetical protein